MISRGKTRSPVEEVRFEAGEVEVDSTEVLDIK